MTPTAPEVLLGNFMSLIEPPPPEAMGDFMAGKVAVTGLISLLMAQEAETGASVRVTENRAIRALFADVVKDGAASGLKAELSGLANGADETLTLAALDGANAKLRTALIKLHETVEQDGPPALERRITHMLREFAQARMLHLPPMPAR